MKACLAAVLLMSGAAMSTAAEAQQATITQAIAGTRLDITAMGEVSRSPTATAALSESAGRMQRVLAALRRAGVADRDIQTSNVSLNPEYRYPENQSPQLVGYTANNSVSVRFRDVRNAGKIIDALVGEGANQINGPSLAVDHPESALDEARAKAIASGRARADLYARALGMRVARLVAVTESAANEVVQPLPMMMARAPAAPSTKIEPGEQKLQVNVTMTFELQ